MTGDLAALYGRLSSQRLAYLLRVCSMETFEISIRNVILVVLKVSEEHSKRFLLIKKYFSKSVENDEHGQT